jgi:hypothetical protein
VDPVQLESVRALEIAQAVADAPPSMSSPAPSTWSRVRRWVAARFAGRTQGPRSILCEAMGVDDDVDCDLRSSLRVDGARIEGRVVRCAAKAAWFAPRTPIPEGQRVISGSLELCAPDGGTVAHVAVVLLGRDPDLRLGFASMPVVMSTARR